MALKKLELNHLELILTWRNSLEIRKAMVSQNKISYSEHLKWFDKLKNNKDAKWFLYEDIKKKPSGVIYVSSIDRSKKNGVWGFYKSPHSARGVGLKMGIEGLEYFFTKLKLNTIYGEVRRQNDKSIKFHKKLGFIIIDNKQIKLSPFTFSDSTFKFRLTKEIWNDFQPKLQG